MLLQPLNPLNLATVLVKEAIILAFLGFIPGFVVPLGLYRLARNATNLPIYMTLFRAVFVLLPGLTQNYEKTNHVKPSLREACLRHATRTPTA